MASYIMYDRNEYGDKSYAFTIVTELEDVNDVRSVISNILKDYGEEEEKANVDKLEYLVAVVDEQGNKVELDGNRYWFDFEFEHELCIDEFEELPSVTIVEYEDAVTSGMYNYDVVTNFDGEGEGVIWDTFFDLKEAILYAVKQFGVSVSDIEFEKEY